MVVRRTLSTMQAGRRRVVRLFALLLGLALAVAATATLVLTEDQQMLQLAVIAALWAFLIAAFVAGQRRSADAATGPVVPGAELEVAQRREVELLTEVRLRREIENALLGHVSGLREDMARMRADAARTREDTQRLRADILERWDGELRVERIAVHAESTRFSGLGSTLAALQDEARRQQGDGRSRWAVTGAPGDDLAVPWSGPREDLEGASTIEFSLVPPTPPTPAPPGPTASRGAGSDPGGGRDAAAAETTGPLYGGPAERRTPIEDSETTVLPRVRLDQPPPPAASGVDPSAGAQTEADFAGAAAGSPGGQQRRFRHEAGDAEGTADVAALLRRLQAEPGLVARPRRRRARDDGEDNDVLARLIAERTG